MSLYIYINIYEFVITFTKQSVRNMRTKIIILIIIYTFKLEQLLQHNKIEIMIILIIQHTTDKRSGIFLKTITLGSFYSKQH